MIQDDYVEIAIKSGFRIMKLDFFVIGLVADVDSLKSFAEVIRADEREGCAQAAGPEDSYTDEWFKAKADSAKRIRARGQE